MTKIKLCGIYRPEDADYVNEAHPDFFGMILNFPKSHRNIDMETAQMLRKKIDPDIPAVGVFVNQSEETVLSFAKENIIQVIQLHGQETNEMVDALKEKTDCPIWKAFKIRTDEDVLKANESHADLVLLDNGYGTGETFDWSLTKRILRPFALAGGLNPENIAEAVKSVSPILLDLSSGVETDKKKDLNKMKAAVAAAHKEEAHV